MFACWQRIGWDYGVYIWRSLLVESGEAEITVGMCDAVCLLTAETVGTTVCKCDDVCLLTAEREGLRCVSVTLFACWRRWGCDYGVYVWRCLPVDSGEAGTMVCICDAVCLSTAETVWIMVCKCDAVCLLTGERVGLRSVCVTLFACWQPRG